MLEMEYRDSPEMKEVRRIWRRTFDRDAEAKECFKVLLHMTGVWNSTPARGDGEAALRGLGMQFLELLGVNHEATEQSVIDALFTIPPFDWTDVERRQKE